MAHKRKVAEETVLNGYLTQDQLPNYDDIITEDDTPVDNIYSEKQQRLLTEPLYASWSGPDGDGRFLALANVGLFYSVREPPLVPDVLLSVGVQAPPELWEKRHRSYFVWEYGKPPDVVIEIVSNRKGGEDDQKLAIYASIGVSYYIILDPDEHLRSGVLRAFDLHPNGYARMSDLRLAKVGLGLTLWRGKYEGTEDLWLRWCNLRGDLIPTGAERAEAERQRAELERQRAEAERQRAEAERQRAEQAERQRDELLAQLEIERQRIQELLRGQSPSSTSQD
ncbi:MAG: Uma2 family endonuclease [Anaerolineae bacterium]